MTKNAHEQLKEMVLVSRIPFDEREQFAVALALLDEDTAALLLGLFESDPSWIEKMYENFKQKKNAIGNKDMDAWRAIMRDEEDLLKSIDQISQEE
jgi:hypothetical protein